MTAQKKGPFPKTRGIRFKPDYGDVGRIELPSTDNMFVPCLILNESYTGSCFVFVMPSPPLQINTVYRIQVGKLDPMKAELLWMQTLDEKSQLIRAGFRYIE